MDANNERAAWALENIGNQLLALNEWLARYGETRLDPPLPSPGIHLIKFRELTAAEREYGKALAEELQAERDAEVRRTLLQWMRADLPVREVYCPVVPDRDTSWFLQIMADVGWLERAPDGKGSVYVPVKVLKVQFLGSEDDEEASVRLCRFFDGRVFDCKLIVQPTGE